MSNQLDGTVALITGASSGIGEATAIALAERGAKVAVAARRKDRLDELVTRIEAAGGAALAIEADMTDQHQAEATVARTVEALGRLDTLFNNAGVMLLAPAKHSELADWDRMIDINIKGLLYTAHAALPHLLSAAEDSPRGVADLINTSSVAGRVARPGSSVYNLTKFGVTAFTDALRQEVAAKHVRVSAVEPGLVATELTEHMNDRAKQALRERLGGVEALHASDIAEIVTFIVTRPRRVAINELLVRPTEQIT
ncbi:MAG: SDR family NAD(P)-dependent oxidoreductase [Thermoleophilaceae bacterium]|nr:SDR family NAD(P)-dependent oxidoreductase [Thermoleophilaceae bacterium]